MRRDELSLSYFSGLEKRHYHGMKRAAALIFTSPGWPPPMPPGNIAENSEEASQAAVLSYDKMWPDRTGQKNEWPINRVYKLSHTYFPWPAAKLRLVVRFARLASKSPVTSPCLLLAWPMRHCHKVRDCVMGPPTSEMQNGSKSYFHTIWHHNGKIMKLWISMQDAHCLLAIVRI